MWLLRLCAVAVIAAGLSLAVKPAAAAPIAAVGPVASRDAGGLLHEVHGRHPICVIGVVPEWGEAASHRHLPDGEAVECGPGAGGDDEDDGDGDGDEGEGNCVQVGPVTVCQ